MVITTTPTVEGKSIREYRGIVTGEAIMGANIFRDLFAGLRDIVGGPPRHTKRSSETLVKWRWPSWRRMPKMLERTPL